MGGIGVVTNPRSRRNKRNPGLQHQLAYVLGEQGALAAPMDLGALESSVEHFREREIDVLAINGGDGTNHVVLSAFLRVYGDKPLPKVALLRGGTMNTVASGLGIRGQPSELLGRLVSAYHSGEPMALVERNLLVVDDQAGFLFGNGILSHFLEAYYEAAEPTPASALGVLIHTVASALVGGKFAQRMVRPIQAEVTAGHRRWTSHSWLTVAAGTVDDIGFGFRPFFRAVDHPGYMHALGMFCDASAVVGQLWNVWRGKPLDHPQMVDGVTDRLVIESDQALPFMIDGDFHQGGQRLEVRTGPRVQFILP